MNLDQQRRLGYATLVVLGVAFIAAVMASNTLLRGMRLDLTENRLYTLSPGTESLLENLEEPINLYFFFSDSGTGDIQFLRSYATRVREMLEEFAAQADGMISLQVIDPEPFSVEEDRAAQFGLRDLNLGSPGDSIYFGLAATNSVGDEAVVEVFEPAKEGSLEYDLARLVYSLANPEKNVVGLVSGVPMNGGFDPQTQQMSQPWVIYDQARQLFDVRTLPAGFDSVDEDIGLLWIVHPAGLDEQTLYAIDQFILRGGRAVIFVDPLAEIAAAGAGPSGAGQPTSSSLDRLFSAWGVEYSPDEVVVDDRYALRINMGTGQPVRHIGLLGLDGGAINDADVVTSQISSINAGTAGHLALADDAELTLTPLLESSPASALMEAARFQFLQDPGELLDGFAPTAEQYVLAARLQGPVESAFPSGPPETEGAAEGAATAADGEAADGEAAPDAEGDAEAADGDAAASGAAQAADGAAEPGGDHLTRTEEANVILVADVDILSDRMWVQAQRSLFGQQLMTAFAGNGDFVTNALANLGGSADLIGLESRQTFSRPFDTVEALRREADARFRATEQRLQAELAETERRLAELQTQREDTSSLLMSPEQQAEIERFQNEQLRIRRELRDVQRDLDSSIERLGTTLKVLNIAAVPVALTLVALLVVFVNRKRKKNRT